MNLKLFGRENLSLVIGVILGAGAGYLYYYFVGCSSGSCPITSNPLISTVYGSLMGGLLVSSFKSDKYKTK